MSFKYLIKHLYFFCLSPIFLSAQSNLSLKVPFDLAVFSQSQDSVTLSWDGTQAAFYTIELDDNSGFSSPLTLISATNTINVAINDLFFETFWRVNDGNNQSESRSFSILNLTSLGSLLYHINGQVGVTTVNNKVSLWQNLANVNYNASQSVSNSRPEYVEYEINDNNVVRFGGTSGASQTYLGMQNVQINTTFTSFFVYKQTSINTTLSYLLGSATPISGIYSGGNVAGGRNFGLYDGSSAIRIPGTTHLKWALRTGLNNEIYENSQFISSMIGTSVTGLTFNTIGLRPDIPTLNLHGDLAEIIIYESTLSTINRELVEEYLITKYLRYPDLGDDILECSSSAKIGIVSDPAYNSIQWSTGASNIDSISIGDNGWYWVEIEAFDRIIRDSIFVGGLVAKPQLNVLNDTVICAGSTFDMQLENGQAGISYTWNDASNGLSVTISESGTFWVTADNGQGCSFTSDTIDIILDNFPLQQGLGEDRTFCLNTDLYFDYGNDGYPPYDHVWSNGSTNSFISPSTIGFETFSVLVTDALGCVAEDTVEIELINTAGPLVDFNFGTVCPYTQNTFTNFSQLAPGDILTNVQWNFPTTTLIGNSVNYTYAEENDYIVELTINTLAGCEGSKRDTVELFPRPNIYFVTGALCEANPSQFNAGQYSSEIITEWLWDFGDPSSGSNNNEIGFAANHSFLTDGTYNVNLYGTDINGCMDTALQIIEVQPSPNVFFEVEEACEGDFVNFTNSTIMDSPFVVDSYFWQFGDGNTSGQVNPSKAYVLAGEYSVILTAEGSNGCSNALVLPVKVHAYPVVDYNSDLGCAGSYILFEDNSSVNNGSLATVDWFFDGEVGPSGFDVNWIFEEIGQHTVEQVVSSAFGCETSETTTINLLDFLSADFSVSPSSIIAGYQMYFENLGQGYDSTIWIIDNTDTSIANNLFWSFPENQIGDTVEVLYIIFNDAGCSDTIIRNFEILENTTDLAINQLYVEEINDFYVIGVQLANLGSTPITSADLFLSSTDIVQFKETWFGNLETGETENYVFSAQIPSQVKPKDSLYNFLCVEAELLTPIGFYETYFENNEKCYASASSDGVIISIAPNPIQSDLEIKIVLPYDGNISLSIYDMAGRKIRSITEDEFLESGLTVFKLDASTWSNGIYSIALEYNEEMTVSRFVK